MSNIASAIKSHYANLPLGSIDVPEWGVTLHIRAATIGQSAAILNEQDQFRQACKLIQVRSKKEDGSPLFDNDDFDAMISHGEVSTINRIVDEIVSLSDPGEDAGKKP